jgi:lipopolysaccharide export system protein LptC
VNRSRLLIDRLTAWSPVLLLGGLAALTWWLNAQVQPPAPRLDGSGRHDPDFFIEHFRAVNFDENGRARQSLAASRAEHYPDDDSVEFLAPALALTDPGQPQLSLESESGTLSGDRETVTFKGHVHGVRAPLPPGASAGNGPSGEVQFDAETLRVTPKKGRAETDGPVTIEEPRGIIHGVGMVLDNKAKTFKLKSGVRGTVSPELAPK